MIWDKLPTRTLALVLAAGFGWLANDYIVGVGTESFKDHVAAEVARLDTAQAVAGNESDNQRESLIRIRQRLDNLEDFEDYAREKLGRIGQ